MKPFHFRIAFRSKLRQVSQGRAPGSQLHKGQWAQHSHQSIWSDPNDDPGVYFTHSQAVSYALLPVWARGAFQLPVQRCLGTFDMFLASPAAPLMGKGLPSILSPIYYL